MKGWIKMFGLGGNKFMHMAKKGDVQSLGQYASDSRVSTRLAVVNALGTVSNNTDAGNALVVYLRDPDRTVQLAAVKAWARLAFLPQQLISTAFVLRPKNLRIKNWKLLRWLHSMTCVPAWPTSNIHRALQRRAYHGKDINSRHHAPITRSTVVDGKKFP